MNGERKLTVIWSETLALRQFLSEGNVITLGGHVLVTGRGFHFPQYVPVLAVCPLGGCCEMGVFGDIPAIARQYFLDDAINFPPSLLRILRVWCQRRNFENRILLAKHSLILERPIATRQAFNPSVCESSFQWIRQYRTFAFLGSTPFTTSGFTAIAA
jgi:hypothetical protein